MSIHFRLLDIIDRGTTIDLLLKRAGAVYVRADQASALETEDAAFLVCGKGRPTLVAGFFGAAALLAAAVL